MQNLSHRTTREAPLLLLFKVVCSSAPQCLSQLPSLASLHSTPRDVSPLRIRSIFSVSFQFQAGTERGSTSSCGQTTGRGAQAAPLLLPGLLAWDAHQLWGPTQVLLRRGMAVLRAVPPDVTGRVHLQEETGRQPHTSPGRFSSPSHPLSSSAQGRPGWPWAREEELRSGDSRTHPGSVCPLPTPAPRARVPGR